MKIIGVDNYDRENVSDVLVCENVKNDYYGESIIEFLNYGRKLSTEERENITINNKLPFVGGSTFYKLVDNNYQLYDSSTLY